MQRQFRKKTLEIVAVELCGSITVSTLEGNVEARAGDWLITGVDGEQYPCSPTVFKQNYEHVTGNRYRKRPVIVTAIPLVHRTTVETPDGDLVGQPGDRLIFDENSMSTYPIKLDVFVKTYEQVA